MPDPRPAAVIVLAAGEGKRMRSATPKVLHQICGRSLLGHVLAATEALEPAGTVVVVGHGRDHVTEHLAEVAPHAVAVVQEEQRGTGHAVRTALATAEALDGTVVVVPGDTPLLTAASLHELVALHQLRGAAATLLTAELPDPTGYGRVLRDGGAVLGVVEHRDADPAQLGIREVATSVYAFEAGPLRAALARLSTDNSQGEEYLTDVIGILSRDGAIVAGSQLTQWEQVLGINDRLQLATAGQLLRDRILHDAMLAGVTVLEPTTTWVDVGVRLEPDVTLLPGTRLHGSTAIAAGAVIGPDTTLTDTTVEAGAQVRSSTCNGAYIGPLATVGPYTYLRPGSCLGRGAKAGAFVEMKAAEVGEGAKVPHLTYVGDATIGPGSNIGAATVFVNYDGQAKHRTTVGADVRIGSDTMLVAPVDIGDGAYTAAGSVITEDVPAGALALGRARQRTIEGWVERSRPGTSSADSAAAALANDRPTEEQQ
ncbi:MAG: bifunctional UDP-N-acetylglucosamine diphosphorylase/glucosamine-1-phosphate N-acetyltransferase GlmU [Frankiaceae bacterium]